MAPHKYVNASDDPAPQPESVGVLSTLETALDLLAQHVQRPQVAARAGRAAVEAGLNDIEAARTFLRTQSSAQRLTAAEADAVGAMLLRVTRPDMLRMGLTVPQAELALSAAVKLRQHLALANPETRAWVEQVSQNFAAYGRSKGGEPVDVDQLMTPMGPRRTSSDAADPHQPDGQEPGHG